MKASRRAELCLEASTTLSPDTCIELIRKAVTEVKPGLNYAGSGLELLVTGNDKIALIEMMSNAGKVCDFPAYTEEEESGRTTFHVGGLHEYKVTKHTFMFIPIGEEVNGYGLYKKFLAAIEQALKAADPRVVTKIAVPEADS